MYISTRCLVGLFKWLLILQNCVKINHPKQLEASFNHWNKSNFCGKMFFFFKFKFWEGHEVLKLYFKCSKNSISWNIRPPKYPFFNFGSKLFILNFEAVNFWGFWGPAEMRGNNFEEKRLLCWFSSNSEAEVFMDSPF